MDVDGTLLGTVVLLAVAVDSRVVVGTKVGEEKGVARGVDKINEAEILESLGVVDVSPGTENRVLRAPADENVLG